MVEAIRDRKGWRLSSFCRRCIIIVPAKISLRQLLSTRRDMAGNGKKTNTGYPGWMINFPESHNREGTPWKLAVCIFYVRVNSPHGELNFHRIPLCFSFISPVLLGPRTALWEISPLIIYLRSFIHCGPCSSCCFPWSLLSVN